MRASQFWEHLAHIVAPPHPLAGIGVIDDRLGYCFSEA
jgi:hypothetical protein